MAADMTAYRQRQLLACINLPSALDVEEALRMLMLGQSYPSFPDKVRETVEQTIDALEQWRWDHCKAEE